VRLRSAHEHGGTPRRFAHHGTIPTPYQSTGGALSDLLKMFDLLHDFLCCQIQLKPPWQEGHYMFDEMYMTADDG
jgi:hypothetical protein